MALDCPKCGLVNPTEAQRCDCGYDFVSQMVERSFIQPKRSPIAGSRVGSLVIYLFLISFMLGFSSCAIKYLARG